MPEWTEKKVIEKLVEINAKGFLKIPDGMYRNDDGVVGQILEREFGVDENNFHLADLGTYELKGARKGKKNANRLTLFHKTSTAGMKPLDIFERYAYTAPSKRDPEVLMKKLFTTVRGTKANKKGFILKANSETKVDLYHKDDYLATWDLSNEKGKISQIVYARAETRGKANSANEEFHFVEAFILSEPKDISTAIATGAVDMDLCIDQPVDQSKAPHDRGPHIRINVKKLDSLFGKVIKVL